MRWKRRYLKTKLCTRCSDTCQVYLQYGVKVISSGFRDDSENAFVATAHIHTLLRVFQSTRVYEYMLKLNYITFASIHILDHVTFDIEKRSQPIISLSAHFKGNS